MFIPSPAASFPAGQGRALASSNNAPVKMAKASLRRKPRESISQPKEDALYEDLMVQSACVGGNDRLIALISTFNKEETTGRDEHPRVSLTLSDDLSSCTETSSADCLVDFPKNSGLCVASSTGSPAQLATCKQIDPCHCPMSDFDDWLKAVVVSIPPTTASTTSMMKGALASKQSRKQFAAREDALYSAFESLQRAADIIERYLLDLDHRAAILRAYCEAIEEDIIDGKNQVHKCSAFHEKRRNEKRVVNLKSYERQSEDIRERLDRLYYVICRLETLEGLGLEETSGAGMSQKGLARRKRFLGLQRGHSGVSAFGLDDADVLGGMNDEVGGLNDDELSDMEEDDDTNDRTASLARQKRRRVLNVLATTAKKLETNLVLPLPAAMVASRLRNELILSFSTRVLALREEGGRRDGDRVTNGNSSCTHSDYVSQFVEWYVNEIVDPFAMSRLLEVVPLEYLVITTCRLVHACDANLPLRVSQALPDLAHVMYQAVKEGREEPFVQLALSPSVSYLSALGSPITSMLLLYAALLCGQLDVVAHLISHGFYHTEALLVMLFLHPNWEDPHFTTFQTEQLHGVNAALRTWQASTSAWQRNISGALTPSQSFHSTARSRTRSGENGEARCSPCSFSNLGTQPSVSESTASAHATDKPWDEERDGRPQVTDVLMQSNAQLNVEDLLFATHGRHSINKTSNMVADARAFGEAGESCFHGQLRRLRVLLSVRESMRQQQIQQANDVIPRSPHKNLSANAEGAARRGDPLSTDKHKPKTGGTPAEEREDCLGTTTFAHLLRSKTLDGLTMHALRCTMMPAFSSPLIRRLDAWCYTPLQQTTTPLLIRADTPIDVRRFKSQRRHLYPIGEALEENTFEREQRKEWLERYCYGNGKPTESSQLTNEKLGGASVNRKSIANLQRCCYYEVIVSLEYIILAEESNLALQTLMDEMHLHSQGQRSPSSPPMTAVSRTVGNSQSTESALRSHLLSVSNAKTAPKPTFPTASPPTPPQSASRSPDALYTDRVGEVGVRNELVVGWCSDTQSAKANGCTSADVKALGTDPSSFGVSLSLVRCRTLPSGNTVEIIVAVHRHCRGTITPLMLATPSHEGDCSCKGEPRYDVAMASQLRPVSAASSPTTAAVPTQRSLLRFVVKRSELSSTCPEPRDDAAMNVGEEKDRFGESKTSGERPFYFPHVSIVSEDILIGSDDHVLPDAQGDDGHDSLTLSSNTSSMMREPGGLVRDATPVSHSDDASSCYSSTTGELRLFGEYGLAIGFLYNSDDDTMSLCVNGLSLGVVLEDMGTIPIKRIYPAATIKSTVDVLDALQKQKASSGGAAVVRFAFEEGSLVTFDAFCREEPATSVCHEALHTDDRSSAPELVSVALTPRFPQPRPSRHKPSTDCALSGTVKLLDGAEKFRHLFCVLTSNRYFGVSEDQRHRGTLHRATDSRPLAGESVEVSTTAHHHTAPAAGSVPVSTKLASFCIQQLLNEPSRGTDGLLYFPPLFVRRRSDDTSQHVTQGVVLIPENARICPLSVALVTRQRDIAYDIATHPLTSFHQVSEKCIRGRKSALLAACSLGYSEVVQVLLERMAVHEVLELFGLRVEHSAKVRMQHDHVKRNVTHLKQTAVSEPDVLETGAGDRDNTSERYATNAGTVINPALLYSVRRAEYTPLHCALLGGNHTDCATALLNFLFSVLCQRHRHCKRGSESGSSPPEKQRAGELDPSATSLLRDAISLHTRSGESSLLIATRYKNVGIAERLLSLGANPSCFDRLTRANCLELACANHSVDIARALLRTNDYRNSPALLNHAGVTTPLCWCALNNLHELIPFILENGADPSISLDGYSPLLLAVTCSSSEAALRLMECCVTEQAVGATRKREETPSSATNQVRAVPHLSDVLEDSYPDDMSDAYTVRGRQSKCDSAGPPRASPHRLDVNAVDPRSNCTALHIACETGQLAVVQSLLEKGATLDTPCKMTFWNPLHTAIINNHEDIAMLLLEHAKDKLRRGVCALDVAAIDHQGDTALHMASRMGMANVVEYMMVQFSEEEIARLMSIRRFVSEPAAVPYLTTNRQGKTPLLVAIQAGEVETAELLISLTRADAPCSGGPLVENTCMAVHHAVSKGLHEVVLAMFSHEGFPVSEEYRQQFMKMYSAARDKEVTECEASVNGTQRNGTLPPQEMARHRVSVKDGARYGVTNYTDALKTRANAFLQPLKQRPSVGLAGGNMKRKPVPSSHHAAKGILTAATQGRNAYIRSLLIRGKSSLSPQRAVQLLLRGFALPELYVMVKAVAAESIIVGIQNPLAMMYGESIAGFLHEHFHVTVAPTEVVSFSREVLNSLQERFAVMQREHPGLLPFWYGRVEEIGKMMSRYPPFCLEVIRVVRLYGRSNNGERAMCEILTLVESHRAREETTRRRHKERVVPSRFDVSAVEESIVDSEVGITAIGSTAVSSTTAFPTEEHFCTPFNYTILQLVASLGLSHMVRFLVETFHLNPLYAPKQEPAPSQIDAETPPSLSAIAVPSSHVCKNRMSTSVLSGRHLFCDVELVEGFTDNHGYSESKWWWTPYRLSVQSLCPDTVAAFLDCCGASCCLRPTQAIEDKDTHCMGDTFSQVSYIDHKEPIWVDSCQQTALQEIIAHQLCRDDPDKEEDAESPGAGLAMRQTKERRATAIARLLIRYGAATSGLFDSNGMDAWLLAVSTNSSVSDACALLLYEHALLLQYRGSAATHPWNVDCQSVLTEYTPQTSPIWDELNRCKEVLLVHWWHGHVGDCVFWRLVDSSDPSHTGQSDRSRSVSLCLETCNAINDLEDKGDMSPVKAGGSRNDLRDRPFHDSQIPRHSVPFTITCTWKSHSSTEHTNPVGVAAVGQSTSAAAAPPHLGKMPYLYTVYLLFSCAERNPGCLVPLLRSYPALLSPSVVHPVSGDSLLTALLQKAHDLFHLAGHLPHHGDFSSSAALVAKAAPWASFSTGLPSQGDLGSGVPAKDGGDLLLSTMTGHSFKEPFSIPAVRNLVLIAIRLMRTFPVRNLYEPRRDGETALSLAASLGYAPLIEAIVNPPYDEVDPWRNRRSDCDGEADSKQTPEVGACALSATLPGPLALGMTCSSDVPLFTLAQSGKGEPDPPLAKVHRKAQPSAVKCCALLETDLQRDELRHALATRVYYGEDDATTINTIIKCIPDVQQRLSFLALVYPNVHPVPALALAAEYAGSAAEVLTRPECVNAFWVNLLYVQFAGRLDEMNASNRAWSKLLRVLLPIAPAVPVYLLKKYSITIGEDLHIRRALEEALRHNKPEWGRAVSAITHPQRDSCGGPTNIRVSGSFQRQYNKVASLSLSNTLGGCGMTLDTTVLGIKDGHEHRYGGSAQTVIQRKRLGMVEKKGNRWVYITQRIDIFLQVMAMSVAESLLPVRASALRETRASAGTVNNASRLPSPTRDASPSSTVKDPGAQKGLDGTLLRDVIELAVRFDNVSVFSDLVNLKLPDPAQSMQLSSKAVHPGGGMSQRGAAADTTKKVSEIAVTGATCALLANAPTARHAASILAKMQAALWSDLVGEQHVDLLAVIAGSICVLQELYEQIPGAQPLLSILRYDRINAVTGFPEDMPGNTGSPCDGTLTNEPTAAVVKTTSFSRSEKGDGERRNIHSLRTSSHGNRPAPSNPIPAEHALLHEDVSCTPGEGDDEDDMDFARRCLTSLATTRAARKSSLIDPSAFTWGVGAATQSIHLGPSRPSLIKAAFTVTSHSSGTSSQAVACGLPYASGIEGPLVQTRSRGREACPRPTSRSAQSTPLGRQASRDAQKMCSTNVSVRPLTQSTTVTQSLQSPGEASPISLPPKWFMYLQCDWAMHAALVLQSPKPAMNSIDVILYLMDKRAPLSVSVVQMFIIASRSAHRWYSSKGDLLTISYRTGAHGDTLIHLLVMNDQLQLAEYYLAFCLYFFSRLKYDEPHMSPGVFPIRETQAILHPKASNVPPSRDDVAEDAEFGDEIPKQPATFLRHMLRCNHAGLTAFDYARSAGMVQLLQHYGCVPPTYRPNPHTFTRAAGLRALVSEHGHQHTAVHGRNTARRTECLEEDYFFRVPRIVLLSENFLALQDGDNGERINNAAGFASAAPTRRRYKQARRALFRLAATRTSHSDKADSGAPSSGYRSYATATVPGMANVADVTLLRNLLASQRVTGCKVLPILFSEEVSLLHIGLCAAEDHLALQYGNRTERNSKYWTSATDRATSAVTAGTMKDGIHTPDGGSDNEGRATFSSHSRSAAMTSTKTTAIDSMLNNGPTRDGKLSNYTLSLLPPLLRPEVTDVAVSGTGAKRAAAGLTPTVRGTSRQPSVLDMDVRDPRSDVAHGHNVVTHNAPSMVKASHARQRHAPFKSVSVSKSKTAGTNVSSTSVAPYTHRDILLMLQKRQFVAYPLSLPAQPVNISGDDKPVVGSRGGGKQATEKKHRAKGKAEPNAAFLNRMLAAQSADAEEMVEESTHEHEAAFMISLTPMQLAQAASAIKGMSAALTTVTAQFISVTAGTNLRQRTPPAPSLRVSGCVSFQRGSQQTSKGENEMVAATTPNPFYMDQTVAGIGLSHVADQLDEWVTKQRVKQRQNEKRRVNHAEVSNSYVTAKSTTTDGGFEDERDSCELTNHMGDLHSRLDGITPIGGVSTAHQQTLMRLLLKQFGRNSSAKLSKDMGLTVAPNYDVEATGDAVDAVRRLRSTAARYSDFL